MHWFAAGPRRAVVCTPSNGAPFAPMHTQEGQHGWQQAVWTAGGPGQAGGNGGNGGNGGAEPPASPSDTEVRLTAFAQLAQHCNTACLVALQQGCGWPT